VKTQAPVLTSGVLSAIPAAHAAAQRMAVYGQADGFPVRTREFEGLHPDHLGWGE